MFKSSEWYAFVGAQHAAPLPEITHSGHERLIKTANAAFGESTPQATAWLEPVKAALYDGQLGAVMRACRAVSPLACKPVTDARSHFATNRTRLRYAKIRALGLQIGSGSMENGCKQLGLARLSIVGARLLGKTRAAFLSREITLPPTLEGLQVARLPLLAPLQEILLQRISLRYTLSKAW